MNGANWTRLPLTNITDLMVHQLEPAFQKDLIIHLIMYIKFPSTLQMVMYMLRVIDVSCVLQMKALHFKQFSAAVWLHLLQMARRM